MSDFNESNPVIRDAFTILRDGIKAFHTRGRFGSVTVEVVFADGVPQVTHETIKTSKKPDRSAVVSSVSHRP